MAVVRSVELRVHGVSGGPATELLNRVAVTRVAGDRLAGFWRPTPPDGDQADPDSADPNLSGRAANGAVDVPIVEGYSWGGLNSGAAARAFWLLLIPFTLVNLAPRLRPPSVFTAGTVRRPPWQERLLWWLSRLLAVGLTATITLTAAGVGISHLAWRCGQRTCAGLPTWSTDALAALPPGVRLLVGALVPAATVLLLILLGRGTAIRYENVDATPEAEYAPENPGDPPPVPSRRSNRGNATVGSTTDRGAKAQPLGDFIASRLPSDDDVVEAGAGPVVPPLLHPDFWRGRFLVPRLRALHIVVAVAAIAHTVVVPAYRHDHAIGAPTRWFGMALWLLIGLVVIGAAMALAMDRVTNRGPLTGRLWIGLRVAYVVVAGLALLVVAYVGWPRPEWRATGQLSGYDLTAALLFGVEALVVLTMGVVVAVLWRRVRRHDAALRRTAKNSTAKNSTADDSTANDGIAGDNAAGDNAAGDNAAGDNAAGDNAGEVSAAAEKYSGLGIDVAGRASEDGAAESRTGPGSEVDSARGGRPALGGYGTVVAAAVALLLAAGFSAATYQFTEMVFANGLGWPGFGELTRSQTVRDAPVAVRAASFGYAVMMLWTFAVAFAMAAWFVYRSAFIGRWRPGERLIAEDYRAEIRTRRRDARIQCALWRAGLVDRLGTMVGVIVVPPLVVLIPLVGWVLAAQFSPSAAGSLRRMLAATAGLGAVGTYGAVLSLLAMFAVGVVAFRASRPRRTVGVLWDVLAFWPRAVHPLAAPCYSERTVPELRNRLRWYAAGAPDSAAASVDAGPAPAGSFAPSGPEMPRPMEAGEKPDESVSSEAVPEDPVSGDSMSGDSVSGDRVAAESVSRESTPANRDPVTVILAGHSQGSVIAASVLLSVPAAERSSIRLITVGCVLHRVYGRYFPAYFGPDTIRAIATSLREKPIDRPRWLNLWRVSDPLGGRVGVAGLPTIDRRLRDPEYLPPPGDLVAPPIHGHCDYFDDPTYRRSISEPDSM